MAAEIRNFIFSKYLCDDHNIPSFLMLLNKTKQLSSLLWFPHNGQALCSTSEVHASTPVDDTGGATWFPLYCLFVFEQRTPLICSIPTSNDGTETATVRRTKMSVKKLTWAFRIHRSGSCQPVWMDKKTLIQISTLIAVELLLNLYTRSLVDFKIICEKKYKGSDFF